MEGCNGRICPCNNWINCIYYKPVFQRKWKKYNPKFFEEIHEYYRDNFRIKLETPDIIVNG